jgi:hypothetical protein
VTSDAKTSTASPQHVARAPIGDDKGRARRTKGADRVQVSRRQLVAGGPRASGTPEGPRDVECQGARNTPRDSLERSFESTALREARAHGRLAEHIGGLVQTLPFIPADLGFEDLGGSLSADNRGQ